MTATHTVKEKFETALAIFLAFVIVPMVARGYLDECYPMPRPLKILNVVMCGLFWGLAIWIVLMFFGVV